MKTLNVTKELSSEDVVREAQDSEIVLMSNGHPVALVSALDDDEGLHGISLGVSSVSLLKTWRMLTVCVE